MYSTKILLVLIGFCISIQAGMCQGKSTFDSLSEAFFNANDLSVKQKCYNELIARFPEKRAAAKASTYDDMKLILAVNYLDAGDSI
jgi:hypothetical protein